MTSRWLGIMGLLALMGVLGCAGSGSDRSSTDDMIVSPAAPEHHDMLPQESLSDVVRAIFHPQVMFKSRLDDPMWQNARRYGLGLYRSSHEQGSRPSERGGFSVLMDYGFLYVGFQLIDTDIIQQSGEDQQHHYRTGDVLEVFLKPQGQEHYWELYVTPNAKKTAFFIAKRGIDLVRDDMLYQAGFDVSVSVDGTLNDDQPDRGWSGMMAIPLAALKARGVPLDASHGWDIFVGRYNYSRSLADRELTMYPPLPVPSFHQYEYWAKLQVR